MDFLIQCLGLINDLHNFSVKQRSEFQLASYPCINSKAKAEARQKLVSLVESSISKTVTSQLASLLKICLASSRSVALRSYDIWLTLLPKYFSSNQNYRCLQSGTSQQNLHFTPDRRSMASAAKYKSFQYVTIYQYFRFPTCGHVQACFCSLSIATMCFDRYVVVF